MAEEGESSQSNTLAMLCHLSGLFGFLGPLIIWLIKKDNDPVVDREGKEALNFQISIMIYSFVSFILLFVVIGGFLMPIVYLAWLILTVVGAIKANQSGSFTYPLTIRLIK